MSDLDGTMVGEGEAADDATRTFCEYWESQAALAGGVLVYNTGRSLGQFVSLMQQKAGALALPDVLITAVGTKVLELTLSFCKLAFAAVLQHSCPRRFSAPNQLQNYVVP